jgi:hypothetical protein
MYSILIQYIGKNWSGEVINKLSQDIVETAVKGIGIVINIERGKITDIRATSCPHLRELEIGEYINNVSKIKHHFLVNVIRESTIISSDNDGNDILLNIVTERDIVI